MTRDWRIYLRWQAAQEPLGTGLNRLLAGHLDDAAMDCARRYACPTCKGSGWVAGPELAQRCPDCGGAG